MTEEGILHYGAASQPSPQTATAAPQSDTNKTTTKPLTVLKTLVGKIVADEFKVPDEKIAKAVETLNKAQMISKPADKGLLKHIVDGLASGEYKCDEKIMQSVADALNQAQTLDKFSEAQ